MLYVLLGVTIYLFIGYVIWVEAGHADIQRNAPLWLIPGWLPMLICAVWEVLDL